MSLYRGLVCAVLLVPLAAPPAGAGENYALLVAVGDYDVKELRPLKYTRADILDFQRALAESGFPAANIVLMHDDIEKLAAYYRAQGADLKARDFLPLAANIRKELELLLGRLGTEDSVVVAFSGHGVQFKGDKKSYFCPSDAKLEHKDSLIAFEEVFAALKASSAGRKMLLIDACQNDPLSEIGKSRKTVDLDSITRPQSEALPEGIIALFSCRAGQKSFEIPELGHGVFFYHLLDAWKGKGDLNGDGKLSYQELATYTEKMTSEYAAKNLKVLQTPQLKAEFSGEWILRTITPNDGFVSVFNGRDLTGWTPAGEPSVWSVKNGVLRGETLAGGMKKNAFLRLNQTYRNFELRLEVKMPRGNSGVQVRSSVTASNPGTPMLGPQVEISDDETRYWWGSVITEPTGEPSVKADFEKVRQALRPTEYNDLMIRCIGNRVAVSLNDVTLVDAAEFPSIPKDGFIALQVQRAQAGKPVEFRNIRLKVLKENAAIRAD